MVANNLKERFRLRRRGHRAMAGRSKGGVGQAAVTLADGSTVAAIVVANPMGAVAGPDGRLWPIPAVVRFRKRR